MNYMRTNLEYLAYSIGYTTRQLYKHCHMSCDLIYVPGDPSISEDYLDRIRRFVKEKAQDEWVFELFDRCVEEPLKKTDVVYFGPKDSEDSKRLNLRRLRYFLSIDMPTMVEKTHFSKTTIHNVETGKTNLHDYHLEAFDKVFKNVSARKPLLRDIYKKSKTHLILNHIPKGAHCEPHPHFLHRI